MSMWQLQTLSFFFKLLLWFQGRMLKVLPLNSSDLYISGLQDGPDRGSLPRVGVIIKWPLNGQFHDAVTDVSTSQTAVIRNQ